MPGVIALLDAEASDRIERIWDGMEREFAIPRGYPGALPHVTFHLADGYELDSARAVIALVSMETTPLELRTTGLGLFTGDVPVIHLPVVRTPLVAALHRRLLVSLASICTGHVPYYGQDQWMPHITLGYSNVPAATYGGLLPWLLRQDLAGVVRATTVAIAENTLTGVNVIDTFPLLG